MNMRRFLRYDVVVPIYLEQCDREGVPIGFDESKFFTVADFAQLAALKEDIARASGKLAKANPALVAVFHNVDRRLGFLQTLLEELARFEDPKEKSHYKYILRENAKIKPPQLKASKVSKLIGALYDHTDMTMRELLHVIETAQEKLYIFPLNPVEPFDHSKYVLNLEKLAQQGNPLGEIILLLEEKYNLLLTVLQRFKDFFRMRADVAAWPVQQVNLSAGGIGLWYEKEVPMFYPINVFIQLDELMALRGEISFVRKLRKDDRPWRVGIDFGLMLEEDQRKITLFLQHREVSDTVEKYPEFPGLSAL